MLLDCLEPFARERLRLLGSLWADPRYGPYGPSEIADEIKRGAAEEYITRIIDAVHRYFALLAMWNDFGQTVANSKRDPDNRWLFRPV